MQRVAREPCAGSRRQGSCRGLGPEHEGPPRVPNEGKGGRRRPERGRRREEQGGKDGGVKGGRPRAVDHPDARALVRGGLPVLSGEGQVDPQAGSVSGWRLSNLCDVKPVLSALHQTLFFIMSLREDVHEGSSDRFFSSLDPPRTLGAIHDPQVARRRRGETASITMRCHCSSRSERKP